MQHFYLSVRARSPLAIRSDHAADGAKTLQYIAGSTLLGSIATAHRLLRPKPEKEEFEDLFLREKVYFPHLYPAYFEKSKSKIAESNLPVVPLPKTAQTCKRFSGFIPVPGEEVDEERHGIRDSLLERATFCLLDKEKQPIQMLLAPLSSHASCTKCERIMEYVSGYYRHARSRPNEKMKAVVKTRLQTRVGINRDWGTAEDRILYNREVFEQDMQFWGEVILPDTFATTFQKFIEEADAEDVIRIGTGRTRGLGKVNLVVTAAPARNFNAFKERLSRFNTRFTEQLQAAHVAKIAPFYIAVTFHSATLLLDSFMRYSSILDPEILLRALNNSSVQLERVYQLSEVQRIGGWNDLWGTPRMNEYAIEAGSTFLFACSQELDDSLIQALYSLEEEGIGRRRSEGFGRICISDPFHLEGEQA